MAGVQLLSRCRFPRSDRDHVSWVLLRKQAEVRCAGELETDRFLAVVTQAVTHASREAFVGDADVLADPEAGDARERARRRLEDEADGAGLALRGELVVERVQHDRVGLPR